MKLNARIVFGLSGLLLVLASSPAHAMTPAVSDIASLKVVAVVTPEPASASILAVGSAALLLRRRRR